MPDSEGNCPGCRTNLVPIEKDPDEQLQFYCVVCKDFFFSCRDDTGLDQAPCPECGDLSNTPDFHVDAMQRDQLGEKMAGLWILKILAILLFSGAGWAVFKIFFGQ